MQLLLYYCSIVTIFITGLLKQHSINIQDFPKLRLELSKKEKNCSLCCRQSFVLLMLLMIIHLIQVILSPIFNNAFVMLIMGVL